MIQSIAPEVTIAAFSAITVLGGYIWNETGKRISKLEDRENACPFPSMTADIREIKNDIVWIKKSLNRN